MNTREIALFFVISTGNLNDVTERQSPLLVDGMELREAIRARNGLVIVLGELLGDSSFFFFSFLFLLPPVSGEQTDPGRGSRLIVTSLSSTSQLVVEMDFATFQTQPSTLNGKPYSSKG